VVLLAGVGNGAAMAVSWPMLSALIPVEKTGVFAGLKAAAESIAIPLSVVVAAEVFLPCFGYRGIFATLALSIITALVLLLRFVRAVGPGRPRGTADIDHLAHVSGAAACYHACALPRSWTQACMPKDGVACGGSPRYQSRP
jgi:MFS family permease